MSTAGQIMVEPMPPMRLRLRLDMVDPLAIARVRTLEGRRWHHDLLRDGKPWSCPDTADNREKLKSWGCTLPLANVAASERRIKPVRVAGIRCSLRKYQEVGIAFIEANDGRALVGDSMGLGKTVQALGWLWLRRKNALPAVIVCPAGLKDQWAEECERFTDLRPAILSGQRPRLPKAADLLIINYEVLQFWVSDLREAGVRTLVLDECHRIKNLNTKRSKASRRLGGATPHVVGLSGTPVLNRPAEFFPILNLIRPDEFPSWFSFGMQYCGPREKDGITVFDGASNLEELSEKLQNVMIRRLKRDVLRDLPEKQQATLLLTPSPEEKKIYNERRRKIFGKLHLAGTQLAKAAVISALRKIALDAKAAALLEWLEDWAGESKADKIIIWVVHHAAGDWLGAKLPAVGLPHVLVDGRVGKVERRVRLKRFKADPAIRALVCSIAVGGEGLNLTCATEALFVEMPWTPGGVDQAEDRIHRLGQERAVRVWYSLAAGTVEEDIFRLLEKKRETVETLLDGGKRDVNRGNIMKELFGILLQQKEKGE